MTRFRECTLLNATDSVRMAWRFPRTAIHMLRDSIAGCGATSFPRRLGLFLTNRCDFACPMCAVQDARDEGLARGGDMPFEIVEKVLTECSPYQPVVDFIGGEPLLYPNLRAAVKFASERNVLAVVTTNGLKLRNHAASAAHNLGLVIAKAVRGQLTAGVPAREILQQAALFAVQNRDGWGIGATILTALGNLLPVLPEEETYLALFHGARSVAADCDGEAPRRKRAPLASRPDVSTLQRWLRH